MAALKRHLESLSDMHDGGPPARPLLALDTLEERVVLSAAVVGSANPGALLSQDVVAYDVTTTGRVSFNASAGTFAAEIELPAGVTVDTSALKTLMAGKLAVPKVNPVQAASAFAGLRTEVTSDYDAVRAGLDRQYGGGNVYVSSRQFTEWASPENVAATAATAVATGGATSGQIVQEAKDVLVYELANLYTWLKNKAPDEARATLAAAFRAVVSGQEFDSPLVAVKFVNVRQTYTVGVGGAAAILGDGLGGAAARSVTAAHKGFAVVWKGPGGDSLAAALDRYTGAKAPGAADFRDVLADLSGRPELRGLGRIADAVLTSDLSGAATQLVVDRLAAALNVSPAQLRSLYKPGNPVIDLTQLNYDEKLAAALGRLAAGNEGSAKVTRLEFDLNTSELSAEVQVRHRHTWGSVTDIIGAVGRQVGEWADKAGNRIKQVADAAGNTVRTVLNKGADTVRETFDRAGRLVAKTVTNSAGYKVLEQAWKNGEKTLEVVRDAAGRMVRKFADDGVREVTTLYRNGQRVAETAVRNGVKVLEQHWANGQKTFEAVRDTAGRMVSEFVAQGGQEVTRLYKAGVKSAERVVQNGVRVAEREWENGVKTLEIARDGAGKMVSKYWREGGAEFKNLYTNGVRTAYTKWVDGLTVAKYTYNQAGEKLTAYWKDGARAFSETYQNGVRVTQDVLENGVKVAQHAWNAAGGYVGDALQKAGGGLGGAVNKAKKVLKW